MAQQTKTQHTADTAWKHARGCKRPIADCAHCQANIAWFRSLPLSELAVMLQDRQAPSMPASLPIKPIV